LARESNSGTYILNLEFPFMTELPVIDGIIEQKVKKPDWLRVKLPIGEEYRHVRKLVDTHKLHTI
jgi:lipoic acid synthetase